MKIISKEEYGAFTPGNKRHIICRVNGFSLSIAKANNRFSIVKITCHVRGLIKKKTDATRPH